MRIPDTPICVDQFSKAPGLFFLTHYHSDHTRGLSRSWSGNVVCSSVTARLLTADAGLDSSSVTVLDPGDEREFKQNGFKVHVSAHEANHCPGAVMFLFELPDRRILYTGDFRLDDDITRRTCDWSGVDTLYVDSTYDSPHHRFPSQAQAIARVVELVGKRLDGDVFLAVYRIGKNKVVRAVADTFRRPVYMSADGHRLYQTIGHGDVVTREREATNISAFSRGYFGKYFRWTGLRNPIVIIPTGWATEPARGRSSGRMVYVPYSEHCDYRELHEFIDRISPRQCIAI